jgi:outer membrane receptor protein involved in Fe transport
MGWNKSQAVNRKSVFMKTLMTSTILAGMQSVVAADLPSSPDSHLEEVIVTAQKRSENLQDVPVAVQALGEAKLDQLHVKSLDDYIALLPSVTYGQATGGPGRAVVYMRGLSTGASGYNLLPQNQSPLVATYIDEIPTTSATASLDLHIYDVARVEALAGPQGTFYGSSSEAGTLKIVTNPPDPTKFSAGYDIDVNDNAKGGLGNVTEGFANIPLSSNAAIRIVAYQEHDGGYIDNVFHTITYPSTGFTVNNASLVKNNYNPTDTYGGRVALKLDLNDDWSILASLIGQDQWTAGFFGYAETIGVDQTGFHRPQKTHDSYWAPSLTVTGKIGDFEVTSASSFTRHSIYQLQDYTDYSYFYDISSGYGANYAYGPGGKPIDIGQQIKEVYHIRKATQELRVASPSDLPFRVSGGVYYSSQQNNNYFDQFIVGASPDITVPGDANTIWEYRGIVSEVDDAAFANLAYDILPNLTIDAGARGYHYNIKDDEFTGVSLGYGFAAPAGVGDCIGPGTIHGSPCTDINEHVKQTDATYRGTITYKFDNSRLVYFTVSDGYRPGGINEVPGIQPYLAETLVNYELGWKTSWLDNRLRWNGDLFLDPWSNFQFSFAGPNAVPEVVNAGQAVSQGIESDVSLRVDNHLSLSAAASVIDAHLTQNYCGALLASGQPQTDCATPQAPSGTQLPSSPYAKGNFTARYAFDIGADMNGYAQSSTKFTGGSWNYLQTSLNGIDPRALVGRNPAFFQEDIAGGVNWSNSHLELYIKNAFNTNGEVGRFIKCPVGTCGSSVYVVDIRPLTVGLRFGQSF